MMGKICPECYSSSGIIERGKRGAEEDIKVSGNQEVGNQSIKISGGQRNTRCWMLDARCPQGKLSEATGDT
jgi:hypothetical protein